MSLGLLQWCPHRPSRVLWCADCVRSKPDIPPESSETDNHCVMGEGSWEDEQGGLEGNWEGRACITPQFNPTHTHPAEIAALHALCQLALVCCESWRQKWYSWWGCNYGFSVWSNMTCLFHKAVAQQAISEKDIVEKKWGHIAVTLPRSFPLCWCVYLNQWLLLGSFGVSVLVHCVGSAESSLTWRSKLDRMNREGPVVLFHLEWRE